jgi:hypothetical protein
MTFKKYLTILFLCLTTTISWANTDTDTWYKVEVIVFENNDPQALKEHWPLEPGKPKLQNIKYLSRYSENSIKNFQLLQSKDYELKDAKQRLKRQGHRLLFHRAWQQQIGDENISKSLHLIGGKRYKIYNQPNDSHGVSAQQNISGQAAMQKQYEMDGTLTLSKGRYIHANADFVFHKPMKVLTQVSAQKGISSEKSANNIKTRLAYVDNKSSWQNDPENRLQPLRLSQTRRMKSGEIHYIDHPFYGMIISVTPNKS